MKLLIFSCIAIFLFLAFVFNLIIKGKIREEYSIIWLFTSAVLLFLNFNLPFLDFIANQLGVFYAPALLFLIAIFSILLFLVHISVIISKLQSQIKDLSQELSILNQKNDSLNDSKINDTFDSKIENN